MRQRRPGGLLLLWSLAALLASCSTVREPVCAAGEQRAVSELLYFGTAKPTGVVSVEEWSAFLGNVVTPRNLVHPESESAERAIQAIVAEYKSRIQQTSVLRVKSYACVSF